MALRPLSEGVISDYSITEKGRQVLIELDAVWNELVETIKSIQSK